MSWKQERATLLAHSNRIVAEAKAAGRGLTATERATVKENIEKVEQIDASVKADAKLLADIGRQVSGGSPASQASEDIAEAKFTLTEALRTKKTAQVYLPRKAVQTVASLDSAYAEAGSHSALATLDDQVVSSPKGTAAVSLRDYLTVRRVSTGSVKYLVSDPVTGFQAVPEGGAKPELVTAHKMVEQDLVKIAGYTKRTLEMEQDAAF